MIKKISLKNFRNHDNLNLELKNKFVYINGPNGSGKTSILESIYLISTLKSHRTNSDKNLIKENMPFAKVEIKTNDHQYELVISEKGKVAKYDNKEARKLSEFIGKLKVVMFSPEDLNLIKGSPVVRRSFIDVELMKLDYNYLNNLTKYRNILKQRNALLKNIKIGDDLFFLNILGKKLYEIGIKIIDVREKFIKDLNTKFIEIYEEFNQENKVSIKYIPNLSKEELEKHLTKNQKIDILYKATTQGPHRDDFTILFDGYEAKNYASQGQIRLIVIAVKLALLQIIREVSKEDVILLLDDVLSELDINIREKFLNNLPKEIQIIMNSAMNIKNEEIQIIELKENSK
ncbi:MAG TPA: DNA replication/repair protein RecF [Acholeplasmataceae bacterium]|nr:DNA replication/repair protein RecF [Acholeplasmataceae bacterium]